ncbi:MAG: sugar phosphate isomerase/epimerase [Desulfobacteraceae bacterium]|nr:sugar phosphate isomerase/epimerase [Desulfobacteraceae bacterium]
MTDKKNNSKTHPQYKPLDKSYKNRFPFTVASPSFIYPDHVLPNARMLAPFIDEIELVFFESEYEESLPPEGDIKKLAKLSESTGLTYNVHLPIDVSITDPDEKKRAEAIKLTARTVERARLLEPSTWTLHLPYTGCGNDARSVETWQKLAGPAVKTLLDTTGIASRSVSVETLDYPPAWLKPLADDLDLSICLDIGHLMEHGYDIADAFKTFGERISILHLYGGVKSGRGHIGLGHLPDIYAPAVSYILSCFSGTVSLEVFSRKDLEESLSALARLVWNDGAISS